MKRWTKRILAVAGVAMLGFGAKFGWDDHVKRMVYRDQEAANERIFAQMQREFPLGMPRVQVIEELKRTYPGLDDEAINVDVWLDHEPSFVWFCNFMQPYIEFKFHSQSPLAPLSEIDRHTTGECL